MAPEMTGNGRNLSGGRKVLAWLISLLLASAMLVVLVSRADRQVFRDTWDQMNWTVLALVLASYLVTVWLRAARFRTLLGQGSSVASWYRLTALHNFYFTFIPFKLGEASFLPLVARRGITASQSVPALMLSRLHELIVLLLFGLVGTLGFGLDEALPLLATTAAFCILLLAKSEWLTQLLSWFAKRLAQYLPWKVLGDLSAGIERSHSWVLAHRRRGHRVFGLTLLICTAACLSLALAFLALGVRLDVLTAVFLFAGLALVGALGMFTVAGIGVSELGLAGLMVLAGYRLEEAAALAVLARFLLLGATLAGTAVILALTPASPPPGASPD